MLVDTEDIDKLEVIAALAMDLAGCVLANEEDAVSQQLEYVNVLDAVFVRRCPGQTYSWHVADDQ